MKSYTFTDLIVWQKAHSFVLDVYTVTKAFPKDELFGLTSQFRRAAVSIAANIAEGYRKKSGAEKSKFYKYSQTSLEECRYYVILSSDLNYMDFEPMNSKLSEVSKILETYIKKVNTEPNELNS